jgi:hypothetical protein
MYIPCHEDHHGQAEKAKATKPGSSLTAAPRLDYFILSSAIPIRTFALRTVTRLFFAIRIAGNPLMLASSAPETPYSNLYFWHRRNSSAEIYYPQVIYFR